MRAKFAKVSQSQGTTMPCSCLILFSLRVHLIIDLCFFFFPFLSTVILAEAIPQLGLFISLVGAVSSTALALIFPPIMEMVICSQRPTASLNTMIKDLCILLIGVFGCVTGTYQSVASIVEAFSSKQ